ncbi:hypothetical protein QBC37DRAFT_395066 [Rhypophila decipiens]|uniref:Uncharacterized protein n=1 Tax=Rhypophila decipiens TaxID=261697 RepID=A0AAN6YHB4_9PEZI|nr:hypothetical protein QBC37DRAFT_395066 [Rhypophila decipiens]
MADPPRGNKWGVFSGLKSSRSASNLSARSRVNRDLSDAPPIPPRPPHIFYANQSTDNLLPASTDRPSLQNRRRNRMARVMEDDTNRASEHRVSSGAGSSVSKISHPHWDKTHPADADELEASDGYVHRPEPRRARSDAEEIYTQSLRRRPSRRNFGENVSSSQYQPPGPATTVPKSRTTQFNPFANHPNPLAMHPPMAVGQPPMVSGSSTMPLRKLRGNLTPEAARSRPVNADEINEKIQKMLEATAKLKGNAPSPARKIPHSATTSVTMGKTSIFTKPKDMFKKMSRYLGSSSSKEASRKQEPVLQENSPVASIEMRLNEGVNLNRPKVQQMTGGQIKRKPLPGNGVSLRKVNSGEGRSVREPSVEEPRGRTARREDDEDPFFGTAYHSRAHSDFELRLRASSRASYAKPRFPSEDPFATEGILKADMNSPLDFSPDCASTPRAARARAVRPSSESPTKRRPRPSPLDTRQTTVGGPGWI